MQVTYKFRLYPRKDSRYNLQAMLPKMKEEKEGLKKNGRKVGKLRYKKYGQFKSFILNQSDLNIKGMAKNHWLAQSILDASWSKTLVCYLTRLNKVESAGKIVGDVNPRGTSKEYKYGIELDMDYNASLNILERGIAGQGLPFVPSEVEPLRE